MTDAVLLAVREIQEVHGRGPIDALAVSLSSEFLARAVTETPLAFRSAALVSPTGFRSRDKNIKWRNGTREMPWLHAFFEFPLWSEGFFRLLTSRAGIRYFLNKTWGSRDIDEGLLEYDYLTTHQPGAQHAPYYFVSGFLFSEDITRIYHSLTLPVWMSHGVRGDFVDYTNKSQVEGRANWTIRVFRPARCRTSKPRPNSLRPTMLSLPACRRRRRHKALPCPASSGARMAQTGPTGISAASSKLPEFVGMCKEWARGRRCF